MKEISCMMLDTYGDFLKYWRRAKRKTINELIELWQSLYMANHKELLKKLIQNYEDERLDWRQIAREKVFPNLKQNLPRMRTARKTICCSYRSIYKKAKQKLELDFPVTFVVYVGIGCGAGWATRFEGSPSILLGLENIAELGWHTRSKLQGLVAHEIGHLTHMAWRNQWERFEEMETEPLFRLYSEGFAQRCEHLILGREMWHQAPNRDWESWCKSNEAYLAKMFLNRLGSDKGVQSFFGSWFNIKGRIETGYFLGYQLIRKLEQEYSLREIARLDSDRVKNMAEQYLRSTTVCN
jgi:hypothetical protein